MQKSPNSEHQLHKKDAATPEAKKYTSKEGGALEELTQNTAEEIDNINHSIKDMFKKIEALVDRREDIEKRITNSKLTISKLSESLNKIKISKEGKEKKDKKLKAVFVGLQKLQDKYKLEKLEHGECQNKLLEIHTMIKNAVKKTEFLRRRLNRIGKNKAVLAVS